MPLASHNRHILVITGAADAAQQRAEQLVQSLEYVSLSDPKQAQDYLGQEFDAVIFNAHPQPNEGQPSFAANAFGAITGTIRGGGYLLLLLPENTEKSLFLTRFKQQLSKYRVDYIQAAEQHPPHLSKPPKRTLTTPYASKCQQQAVAAICTVAQGRRKRPCLLTADRGRGKSAALGLAVAELTEQGVNDIIICAPSKKTAAMVFKHAGKAAGNLSFYSPDELQQHKPSANLVLIDEAAAIPLPLLADFLQHYARLVFATTEHGYEGSGRGFAIKFRQLLDAQTPNWQACHLKTPIRWQANDTVELFTFDALLLNAEAADSALVSTTAAKAQLNDYQFKRLNKQQLLADEAQLRQLFGLLVSAHYQTKPSDLVQLLDDDRITLFSLSTASILVAVALVVREGELPQTLADPIFAGKRRVQGHLVAQALSSSIGIKEAIYPHGERISRIAVHPKCQGRGVGGLLLKKIREQSQADYLSTCYGATASLINFWKQAGFHAVHLGIKRDASSGAHSLTMLYPKTAIGQELSTEAQQVFAQNFPQLLVDVLQNLESDIALALLPTHAITLNANEQQRLHHFAHGDRGYENTLYLIDALVRARINQAPLKPQEKALLCQKVLQKQTWAHVIATSNGELTGKKHALQQLRNAVSKMLDIV